MARPLMDSSSRVLYDVLTEVVGNRILYGVSDSQDDKFSQSQLLDAAMCYLDRVSDVRDGLIALQDRLPPSPWPWPNEDWMVPNTERQTLIRAIALLVDEVKRIDRAQETRRAGTPPAGLQWGTKGEKR